MRQKWLAYLPYLVSGLIVVGVGAAYGLSESFRSALQEGWQLVQEGDQQAISEWFRSFDGWGPAMLLLFMFLQMITVILPSFILIVAAIVGYGPVGGTLLAIIGICLAAAIAYWIGHGLGRNALQKLIGQSAEEKTGDLLENYGMGAIALFRLSPFLSNDAISFIAGMLGMPFWRFMVGTLIGITPLCVAVAFFIDKQESLKQGLIWIGIGGIALYGIYVWLDRKQRA